MYVLLAKIAFELQKTFGDDYCSLKKKKEL